MSRTAPLPTPAADDQTFSVEEALKVLHAMRAMLGLPPERFALPAFVGMISDEIEQLRGAGRTDREIAALIATSIGRTVTPEDLGRFYAPGEARRRPE